MLKLVSVSFCIHIFLLLAVLNTYFQSIIESDLPLTASTDNPPAKRILLIVVDGLSAQAIMDENENVAPFLKALRNNNGSWGISYGAAPTETRIGSNAIIGGFREDPRGIWCHWTHYPVKYDTVFEHSTNTWCIAGAECIEDIFTRHKTKNVRLYSYPRFPYVYNGDIWSINKFASVLRNKSEMVHFSDAGNIFSVFLPNLDTTAHNFYQKYSEEVKNVDLRIKNITEIFEKMFKDNKTTFLVTSDHGMRPDAGHGSNFPTEIASPLICWGAGIHKDHKRKNVHNIDIAPLISALLGINFPSNSRGITPINYLNISLEEKYKILLNNLHQIFNIYERRNGKLLKGILINRNHLTMQKIKNRLIEMSITNGTITNETFTRIQDSILMILDAMQYDELYFTYNIIFSGLLAVLFWILYLFSIIPGEICENKKESLITKKFILLAIFYFTAISSVLYSETFFFTYYIFPIGSFCLLMNNYKRFLTLFYKRYTGPPLILIAFFLCFYVSLILGFHNHEYFSATFFLMSLLSYILPFTNANHPGSWNHTWAILCVISSLFSSISFGSSEIGSLLILSGCVLWHLFSLYYFFEMILNKGGFHVTTGQYLIIIVQSLCSFLVAMIRFGTPLIEDCYKLLIVLVVVPLALIPFSMKIVELKIFTIFLGVIPILIVISLPQDLLVLTIFSMLLISSYSIVKINGTSYNTQYLQYFIICLIIIGMNLFCITGIMNLYNLDYPRWIMRERYYDWFKYYVYVLKFLIPSILTGCIMRYIFLKTEMELKTCFIFLEIFFSSMLFYIILRIKNTGSWLQMGTSFINFIIVNFFALYSVLFIQIAHLLMDFGFPFLFGEKLVAFTNSV